MKVGVRKPSIKKSIKARTTGKAKRAVKKAVVPGYGKKGTGIYKDPKKAMYNKVYNKTTVGINPLSSVSTSSSKNKKTKEHLDNTTVTANARTDYTKPENRNLVNKYVFILLALFTGFFGGHWLYAKNFKKALLYFVFCWTSVPFFLSLFDIYKAGIALQDKNGTIRI